MLGMPVGTDATVASSRLLAKLRDGTNAPRRDGENMRSVMVCVLDEGDQGDRPMYTRPLISPVPRSTLAALTWRLMLQLLTDASMVRTKIIIEYSLQYTVVP